MTQLLEEKMVPDLQDVQGKMQDVQSVLVELVGEIKKGRK